MNSTFASLIVVAVLALVRSTTVALPSPLQQMAQALAGVHSYRTVMTSSDSTGPQQPNTTQVNTVYVRSGTTEKTYTVVSVKVQGHALQIENVTNASRACVRQNSKAKWSCQTVKPPKGGADAGLKQQLGILNSQFHWSAAGTSTIKGQQAVGYRAVSGSSAPLHVTATLWLSARTKLPLELRSTASNSVKVGAKSYTNSEIEVVDWSQWNDAALTVPAV